MSVYLSAPLFTTAERTFNEQLALALRDRSPSLDVELPQDFARRIAKDPKFYQKMFRYCIDAIDHCNVVVAIIDGADADSGTCVEIGYARAKGKMVIGVRTDVRACEDRGLNLMVANICSHLILIPSTIGTLQGLADRIVEAIGSFRRR
jgi:nucleoside 2-deoxyribosyltransferase